VYPPPFLLRGRGCEGTHSFFPPSDERDDQISSLFRLTTGGTAQQLQVVLLLLLRPLRRLAFWSAPGSFSNSVGLTGLPFACTNDSCVLGLG
jgi:hypothetical protein